MIIPVGYGQVTHVFEGSAVPRGAVVTHGVDTQTLINGQTLIDDIALLWSSTLLGMQHTECIHVRSELKIGPNSTGNTWTATRGFGGLQSGEAYSANTAALLRKVTTLGGREGRGRMYMPGLSEGQVATAGQLSGATIDAIQAECDDYMSGLDTLGTPMVLLHNSPTEPTVVTTLVCDAIVATQRNRLR